MSRLCAAKAFFLCALVCAVTPAVAQLHNTEPEPIEVPSIFLGGTFSSNFTNTSIDAYSGDELCGVFTNGSGSHFSLLAGYELPTSSSFGYMVSASLRDLSSEFVTTPFNIEHSYDVATGGLNVINRERIYDVSLYGIGASIGMAYHPFERLDLGASLGGYIIPAAHYLQTEHLVTPSVVYTENDLSTRTVSSGSFSAHPFFAALEFRGGYDLPVSERVAFRPYAEAFIGLTPLATIGSSAYRAYSVSGGVALSYRFIHQEEIAPPAPLPIPPPTKPTPTALRLLVRAVGITDHDEEVAEPVVSIENVMVTDVSPTLGYVFFDDGSRTVPSRYHEYGSHGESKTFTTKDFYKFDALGINHELLNVLGKRLEEHPKATITLTGTRSLHSSGDSAATDMIALDRASKVAEYLQNVWQISPSRIKVRSRALPELNSDDASATGQAENRRVEITSLTHDLLEPVETKKIEQTATPPRIKFYQNITSEYGVKSNIVTIRQGGKVIKTFNNLSDADNGEWLWNIVSGDSLITNDSVSWTMDITDSLGQTASASGIIRIKPQIKTSVQHTHDVVSADKSLERFHLLLFDYSSSSELGENSDEVLTKLASAITPDATVTIIGHTDITGDPTFNDKLSYERAARASELLANRLKQLGKSVPPLELEARGSKDILFDNSVAEGRMLSRTVRVTIERDLQ